MIAGSDDRHISFAAADARIAGRSSILLPVVYSDALHWIKLPRMVTFVVSQVRILNRYVADPN